MYEETIINSYKNSNYVYKYSDFQNIISKTFYTLIYSIYN